MSLHLYIQLVKKYASQLLEFSFQKKRKGKNPELRRNNSIKHSIYKTFRPELTASLFQFYLNRKSFYHHDISYQSISYYTNVSKTECFILLWICFFVKAFSHRPVYLLLKIVFKLFRWCITEVALVTTSPFT